MEKEKRNTWIINTFTRVRWTNGYMKHRLLTRTKLDCKSIKIICFACFRNGKTGTLIHKCIRPGPRMIGTSWYGSDNLCCLDILSSRYIHVRIGTFFHNDKNHFRRNFCRVRFWTWFLKYRWFTCISFRLIFNRLLILR